MLKVFLHFNADQFVARDITVECIQLSFTNPSVIYFVLFWIDVNASASVREGNETEVTSKTTAWRKLDRILILLTRQRLGKSFDWGLPVVEVTGTSTLRSVSQLYRFYRNYA